MAQNRRGPMVDRTVLVTGATSGIGKATTVDLAAMGAHVAITGRDPDRTEAAARDVRASGGGGTVDAFVADLSAQAEVHRLADEVLQHLPRLDVLINNVGGYWNTRHVTVEGLEHTFALNHRSLPAHQPATGPAEGQRTGRVTGEYFANCKPRRSSQRSYDAAASARLWTASEDLVGSGV
jgi:NAD(P)-dependent dehydrogenase (short-subunit alcohol dehydrogenase family)